MVGALLFFGVIGLSIALHEVGHLLPAKRFGVRVPQYMVGFGPTLWSRRRGETQYGIKAVPLGGYVRMIGMYPPGPDGTLRVSTTGRMRTMIDDARRQSAEEVGPGDHDRVFYRLSVPKKLTVMLGGPVMNLLLACLLFTVLLVGIGTQSLGNTVRSVVPCLPTTAQDSGAAAAGGGCPAGSQPTPAAVAGLRPGDTITAVGATPVDDWTSLTAAVSAAGTGATTVTFVRDGVTSTAPVTLVAAPRPVMADSAPTGQTEVRPFLGVGPDAVWVRQPVTAVPGFLADTVTRTVGALISFPSKLVELAGDVFSGQQRATDGPISVVGASRLGGEALALNESWETKAAMFVSLAASINLFLFMFNLLPLLPLDGGHVAGALYEGARRQLARFRRRRDPGPVDTARLLPVAYVVTTILLVVGGLVIYADLFDPITLGS
ncbi:MAG: RIP metalloprotease [Actinomycetota bacterium]|nr:MAG: RIP metalloprotease [Actinomycetota bacterium]